MPSKAKKLLRAAGRKLLRGVELLVGGSKYADQHGGPEGEGDYGQSHPDGLHDKPNIGSEGGDSGGDGGGM
jgi:hypothetical protein